MDEKEPMDGVKAQINELLWTCLPGTTTLGEAEDIALNIYRTIEKVWRVAENGDND